MITTIVLTFSFLSFLKLSSSSPTSWSELIALSASVEWVSCITIQHHIFADHTTPYLSQPYHTIQTIECIRWMGLMHHDQPVRPSSMGGPLCPHNVMMMKMLISMVALNLKNKHFFNPKFANCPFFNREHLLSLWLLWAEIQQNFTQ